MKEMSKSVVFMLTQNPSKLGSFPPVNKIAGISRVLFEDEKGKRERIAFYNPSSTTIWADETVLPVGKDVPNYTNILFKNGIKTVSPNEINLLKFLRICGMNEANNETRITNAILFREINVEQKAHQTLDEVKLLDNARHFTSNADIREVRAYALGLAKNAGEINQVQQMSEYEVRLHLRFKAEKNPITFLENMKDQVLINKVKIIQAIYNDTIVHNQAENTLSWKNGNEFLVAPIGTEVIKYLSEMSVKNEKYAQLLKDIELASKGGAKEILQKETPKAPKVEKQAAEQPNFEEETEVLEDDSEEESIEDIIEQLVDMDLLEVSANKVWHTYKRGTAEERKFKGRAEFEAALKYDENFKQTIETILG